MPKEKLELSGFSIIRRLGTGARSTIYLALDEETRQTVALKRAAFERPEDTRIFEQMETEYKVAQEIDHPSVRKCFRLIKLKKLLKVKELLLTMEMFDGQTLEESRSLSLGDVLLVFRMVATALNAMHQAGYIHCDIKPNNILINGNGDIRIIDLGQACKIGTIKPRIQGTPDYIAPEQVQRRRLDQRTDIFNLGATMYWALTGRNVPTLIPQTNDLSSMLNPEKRKIRAPHEIHRRIQPGISKFVMDCVQQSPSDRPATMNDVVSRLDLLIHSIFKDRINNQKDLT